MSDFQVFAQAVNKRLAGMMQGGELFEIIDTCDLYETYLAAFPEGSNPIYRTNRVHECSCCRSFIRNLGGVVTFSGGKINTIWDIPGLPQPYASVAARMAEMIRQYPVAGIYRTSEKKYGNEHTYGDKEHGPNKVWDHLWSDVRAPFYCSDPAAQKGQRATQHEMLKRSLEVITLPCLRQVHELAKGDMIYRGVEHVRALENFTALKLEYEIAKQKNTTEAFLWIHSKDGHSAGFKNTVIGTLVIDLASGMPLEDAVRMFESKVAPENYKRSKSLITEKMVDEALTKLADLGLEHAIERRVAVFEDVSVNDVLFVNNTGRMKMKDGLKAQILKGATKPVAIVESKNTISIDDFIEKILPYASNVRALLRNTHAGNFVTLTAPKHADTGRLLKWNNDFGWSYKDGAADSIRERVKRAGGNVDNAKLRVSLSWFNSDDLDLHSNSPFGTTYYGNKQGILDVDMNAGSPDNSKDPVENQSFKTMRDGAYSFSVNQYASRSSTNVGFEIELAIGDAVWNMSYSKPLSRGQTISLFQFDIIGGVLKNFIPNPQLVSALRSQEIWGLQTEQAHEVTTILNSPNHWEGAGGIGQKHWFFVLDGCTTKEPTRGLYNEFLRGDLDAHRKVFEILGSKTMCDPLPNQMSGLGFTKGRDQSISVLVAQSDIATKPNHMSNYNITF